MKNKILIALSFMLFLLPTSKVEAMLPNEILTRAECPNIELAEAKTDGTLLKVECYETYQEAKDIMNQTENDNLVIIEKGVIIDAKYGVVDYEIEYPAADTKYRYIHIYTTSNGTKTSSYIRGGTPDEAALLDYDYNTKRVKIKIAGIIGWIDKTYRNYGTNGYDIVPLAWTVTPQSYTVTDNNLIHNFPGNVYGNKGTSSLTLDRKPTMLEKGTYYSYDGNYFYTDMKTLLMDYKNGNYDNSINKDKPYYNYYQYLSFRTKTNYTSENINQYISLRTSDPQSKMLNTGDYFIDAQNNYGVNAILMMAIGMNESGRGESNIAKTKNNLFGLNAVDATPGESASSFTSVEDCINNYAYGWLSYGYLDPRDYRFFGANIGNKYQGLNYKYASDPFWSEKAAYYYFDLDRTFGFQDQDAYQLAVLNNDYVDTVYPKKTVDGANVSINYQYKYKNSTIVILEEVEGSEINGNKIWYKIQSDATLSNELDCIGSSKDNPRVIYNWNNNQVYVHSSYFTKINAGTGNIPENVPQPETPPEPENPQAKPISSIVSEANYKYENGNILGINPNTSIETIKTNLTNTGGVITVTDKNGNTKESGKIGTGDKVNITSGVTETLTVLIYGDTNGDGVIDKLDASSVLRHYYKYDKYDGIYAKSLDVNKDGVIDKLDASSILRSYYGYDSIKQ